MKKTIISYTLIFVIAFMWIPDFSVSAEAGILTEEEVLLFEDFQTGDALNMPFFDAAAETVEAGGDIEEYSDYLNNGIPAWTTRSNPANKNNFASDVVNFVKRVNDGTEGNKAASFQMAKWANSSSASYEIIKKLYKYENNTYTPVSITDGMAVIKLDVKPIAGAGTIHIALNSSKAAVYSDPNFRIICADNGAGPVATLSSEYGTIKSGVALSYTDWTTIEYRLDFDNDAGYIYVNGTWISDADVSKIKFTGVSNPVDTVDSVAMGLNYKNGVSASGGGYLIDNISVTKVSGLDVNISAPEDGALNKAILKFNNKISSEGILPGNITVDGTSSVISAVPYGTDGKEYEITFDAPLSPETVYTITMDGIKDVYGFRLTNKAITYRTRDKRCTVTPAGYYTTYIAPGDLSNAPSSQLSNGTITAEITIGNELAQDYTADLILVHKRDNHILDISVVPADTAAETTNTVYTSISVSGVTDNDRLEVYLWDMWNDVPELNSLNALKPVEWITTSGKNTETGYAKSTASDMTGNMSINFTTNIATFTGTLNQTNVSEICALVFNSGYSHETLTRANFKDAVMCIGQSVSNGDGTYSFDLPLYSPADGNVYSAVMGSNAKLVTDSKQYFSTSTVNAAVSAVNSSDAETLRKYLAKEKELISGLYLNDVLQLDVTVYNTLKNPLIVCGQMVNQNFADIDAIRTKFTSEVSIRKAKEDRIDALLLNVTDALWDDIEQILLTDKGGNNDLELPWNGNYKYIENNGTLKTEFYKRLAKDYTFTDLKTLQDTFDALSLTVYQGTWVNPIPGNPGSSGGFGGSGGGGGGGMVSYTGGSKTEKPTPIQPDNAENESPKVSFNDLDSVPWAKEAVESLAELGVINGMSSTEFAPNGIVTREQFVKMIVLAFGLYNEAAESNDFIDVDKNHWSSPYIASAIAKKIINGIDNQHFGIGQELTRAEMATILNRVVSVLGLDLEFSDEKISYTDSNDIPDYAREGVENMSKAGIMNGVGGGEFAPRTKTTRAMAAKVIFLLRGMSK